MQVRNRREARWLAGPKGLATASILVIVSCLSSTFDDGQFVCSPGDSSACPPGMVCAVDGRCRSDQAVGVGGAGAGGGCQATTLVADAAPVDVMVVLEESLSSTEAGAYGYAANALIGLSHDALSDNSALALSTFPRGDQTSVSPPPCACAASEFCRCDANTCYCNQSCDEADYQTPNVAFSDPVGQHQPFADALSTLVFLNIGRPHSADGAPAAPLGLALRGAYDYASGYAAATPDRFVTVMLAADGPASTCDPTSVSDIQQDVAAAAAGPGALRTFVIGLGTGAGSLEPIAVSGGSGSMLVVADVVGMRSAVDEVLARAQRCAYLVPDGVDPDDLRVVITRASSEEALAFVADPAACGADDDGWYFDRAVGPHKILLCDRSCRDPGTTVRYDVGCPRDAGG